MPHLAIRSCLKSLLSARHPLALAVILLAAWLSACKPAATGLDEGFLHPPDAAKPRVYWWWLFNRVDKAGITRDLEEFKAKGIGGVNLICTGGYAGLAPLPGVKFLGPEWRELFRHAVKEAARLKIEMGFNLAGGWVMIGPWVTPDNAMKKVTHSELKVRGPKRFRGALPSPPAVDRYYKDVRVQAFPEEPGKAVDPQTIIDLTNRLDAGGRFEWDVPAGAWTILRTGYTLTGSRWDPYPKGDTFTEGAGYQIDYLNPASLDDHFRHLGQAVLDEAAKAGGHLDYLWSDSWECGKLTWTQDFPAQFLRFQGYDLKPYLPALAGRTVVDAEVTARFKEDFDRTIEDCLADNFYGHFAELCHDRGIRMGSEAAGPGDLPPMDSLKNEGRCDLPAGEFWVNGHFNFPGGYNANPYMRLNLKQTASAAHIYGKPEAMAESFTQQERDRTHWSLSAADLKPYIDAAFGEGINSIMLHQATCQPPSDGKPGYEFCAGQHWNANSTWWEQSPAFFTYLSRCQYMLQKGVFAGDVCYYLGDRPPVIAPPKAEDPTLGPGYDFDYANTEALLTRMSVENGRIVLPDGLSYRLLVLQNCTSPSPETSKLIGDALSLSVSPVPSRSMPLEAVRKIRDLVRAGGTVVGPKPEKASGLKDYPRCDGELRAIADEVWGDCDGQSRTEHRYGQGRVIWGKTPRQVLAEDGVPPDFEASPVVPARGLYARASTAASDPQTKSGAPTAVLDFIHRTSKDADIYFVSNRDGHPVSADCAFRVAGKRPEIWDPASGEIRDAAAFRREDGRTIVPLDFAPMQSLFVVFRKPIAAGSSGTAPRNFPRLVSVQEIAGGWKVAFDPRWGGPESAEFPQLVSWTRRPEGGIKYYSGKATYRKTFDLEPSPAALPRKRLFLDLGAVKAVAEVRLNGRPLGVLWTAPWRVDITDAVRPAGNALEIDIVNLWANRVIGDLNLPKEKRVTVTHDAFRFDMITKTTSLLDSGLLGPVSVLREAGENEIFPALDDSRPDDLERAASRDWAVARFWGEKPKAAGPLSGPVVEATPPFSFVLGGKRSSEFLSSWKLERSSRVIDRDRLERTLTYTDPKTGLEVRSVGVEYMDFPAVEWTVHLRNGGPAKSPLIEDLLAADFALLNASGGEYLLHHSVGSPCQPNDFQPLETILGPGAEKRISAAGGRPTNSDMCYFNIEWPGGGVIAAVGWPGQWASTFQRDRSIGLRFLAGQERTRFSLDPGEEARTPLIVLQFWRGEWIRSQNIWRRWMIAHNLPRPGGKPLPARFDSCYGNLKPLAAEETAMIDGFVRERIRLDAWILDAGWYPNQDWWDNAGTWTPDPRRFPRGLREVADKAHSAGMKFVLWFEPERVTMNSWIAAHHPEWLLPRPNGTGTALKLGPKDSRILDLGDPRVRAWLVDYLDAMFKTEGIDVLRTDFNIDPLPFWRASDPPDRQGLTENHYVTGLLAYWDELERRDPARWIDTCASGGRRLDLETLRRAAPLLRSDYTEHPVAHQSHTYGISLWLPWYGSGTGSDDLYLVRSSICPAWRLGHDMRRTSDNYDWLRREVANFRSIEGYLLGDYYPLAPYSQEENVWMGFQFDSPENGGGAVLAFRRKDCPDDTRRFKLWGLDRGAIYEVTDPDTSAVARLSGAELTDTGVPVRISAKPGAVCLLYRKSPR